MVALSGIQVIGLAELKGMGVKIDQEGSGSLWKRPGGLGFIFSKRCPGLGAWPFFLLDECVNK